MTTQSKTRAWRRWIASFTLVELLVVMGVVGVLMGLLLPAIGAAREKGRETKCVSNMRQFGVAFRLYMDENGGKLPRNYVDNSFNWQSMLVDSGQGGIYFGTNEEFRSFNASGPIIRASTKILCPTSVLNTLKMGSATPPTISISDPHEEWGYCYNHLRNSMSYEAPGWPWWNGSLTNANLDAYYGGSGAKYIVMADGNGANYDPDDWDATTGNYSAWNWPVRKTHGNSVNALFMDGHVESFRLVTTGEKTQFNQAWYGGIPIAGNPYVGY